MPPSKEGGIFYFGYIFFDQPNFILNMCKGDNLILSKFLWANRSIGLISDGLHIDCQKSEIK